MLGQIPDLWTYIAIGICHQCGIRHKYTRHIRGPRLENTHCRMPFETFSEGQWSILWLPSCTLNYVVNIFMFNFSVSWLTQHSWYTTCNVLQTSFLILDWWGTSGYTLSPGSAMISNICFQAWWAFGLSCYFMQWFWQRVLTRTKAEW